MAVVRSRGMVRKLSEPSPTSILKSRNDGAEVQFKTCLNSRRKRAVPNEVILKAHQSYL